MSETTTSRIARTPAPPYYVVTTTTHLRPGYDAAAHHAWGRQLHEDARQIDGFIGLEVLFDGDFSCASSYWRTMDSIRQWRNHPSHLAAKHKAKADWFGPTITRVSRVEEDYGFHFDDQEMPEPTQSTPRASPTDPDHGSPVVAPLHDDALNTEQEAAIALLRAEGRDFNIYRTMLHHTESMAALRSWSTYVRSSRNTLSPRHREIVILRTGAQRGCEYQFLRHAVIARTLGMTEQELQQLTRDNPGAWTSDEALLIEAADALAGAGVLPPDLFHRLTQSFGVRGAIDVIWTSGLYVLIAMFLLSTRVQPDPDILDDSLRPYLVPHASGGRGRHDDS